MICEILQKCVNVKGWGKFSIFIPQVSDKLPEVKATVQQEQQPCWMLFTVFQRLVCSEIFWRFTMPLLSDTLLHAMLNFLLKLSEDLPWLCFQTFYYRLNFLQKFSEDLTSHCFQVFFPSKTTIQKLIYLSKSFSFFQLQSETFISAGCMYSIFGQPELHEYLKDKHRTDTSG